MNRDGLRRTCWRINGTILPLQNPVFKARAYLGLIDQLTIEVIGDYSWAGDFDSLDCALMQVGMMMMMMMMQCR